MSRERLAFRGVRLSDRSTRIWFALCVLEAYLLLSYFAFSSAEPSRELRYLLYPFVWINLGLWAVYRTTPRRVSDRLRWTAVALASGYFLAVLWIPGQIGPGSADLGAWTIRIGWHAPGWGPLLAVNGPVRLYLVPFEVIGYASLAYLVYVAILDASRGILSGLLGLVTCVGCTVPILLPLVGALGGPAAGLSTTAYAWSYDLGTAIFVLTVGLLVWSHHRSTSSDDVSFQ